MQLSIFEKCVKHVSAAESKINLKPADLTLCTKVQSEISQFHACCPKHARRIDSRSSIKTELSLYVVVLFLSFTLLHQLPCSSHKTPLKTFCFLQSETCTFSFLQTKLHSETTGSYTPMFRLLKAFTGENKWKKEKVRVKFGLQKENWQVYESALTHRHRVPVQTCRSDLFSSFSSWS